MRVLEIFREPLANGGQESFLMNMYRNLDRSKVQLDFLTPFTVDNPALKAEIEAMGGRVYSYDHPFGVNNNKVFKQSVTDFLSRHHYDTVHFHSGSTYALMEGSRIASQAGVKNILVHSHCGGFANLKYHVIKTLSVPYLLKYPTHYLACSNLAAQWKFPAQVIKQGKVQIIKNAVDTEKFAYKPELRRQMRQQLGIGPDQLVVGHTGRFSLQKNHSFLIDVFAEIVKLQPNAVLLLIGSGELEAEIKAKTEALNLGSQVKFLGLRKDVAAYKNAMDIFVLPSFFEGLPVVGVEAQATGLPVVTSTAVARELPIEALSYYLDLDAGPEAWASFIVQTAAAAKRQDQREAMAAAGYEIKQAAADFQHFYESLEADHETD